MGVNQGTSPIGGQLTLHVEEGNVGVAGEATELTRGVVERACVYVSVTGASLKELTCEKEKQ